MSVCVCFVLCWLDFGICVFLQKGENQRGKNISPKKAGGGGQQRKTLNGGAKRGGGGTKNTHGGGDETRGRAAWVGGTRKRHERKKKTAAAKPWCKSRAKIFECPPSPAPSTPRPTVVSPTAGKEESPAGPHTQTLYKKGGGKSAPPLGFCREGRILRGVDSQGVSIKKWEGRAGGLSLGSLVGGSLSNFLSLGVSHWRSLEVEGVW